MPRVVTTSRYVTTLGFMAYLTGTQVTPPAQISPEKKTRHTVSVVSKSSEESAVTGIRILDSDTRHERCLPLEGEFSNLRVRWDVENAMG